MAKGFSRPAGGASGGMMQQIQRLQEQLAAAQARLADEVVVGTAGGGAVEVVMTGDQKCRSIRVSAELMTEADPEMLQDLIITAVNLALEQSRALASERLGPLAGGVPF